LRLLTCLRSTDVVTRDHPVAPEAEVTRGDGDEFTVMLPVLAHSGDAAMVADRIVEAMAEPFQLARHELFVTCQIGIAVFAGGTQDKDTVLRQAKLAMRHARSGSHGGGSSVRVYSQELHGRSSSRLTLERELHHALERNELVLHFQPKVDVAADRLCGVEAMVRWNHPQRGLLGPGAFIDVAEESGLVVPMGDWVLNEALRQAVDWRQRGMPPLPVAVNVSSLQLRRPHLDRTVSDALARAGLEGSALCLELTESVMMETGLTVTNALHAIKELGVHLALDDFGTGYSSLSYLRRFPIDELKIDRSFIVECQAANNSATVITEAIIAMAHGLRLRVVAEGVETEQQLDFLRSTGCDQYQGFLFSKAVPAEEFETLFSHVGGVAHRMAAARPVFDPRLTTAAVEFEQFSATEMGTLLPD
jgi:EAL domain-containing protein (putative c-di-GMP-specific phosphodiesterase class I)